MHTYDFFFLSFLFPSHRTRIDASESVLYIIHFFLPRRPRHHHHCTSLRSTTTATYIQLAVRYHLLSSFRNLSCSHRFPSPSLRIYLGLLPRDPFLSSELKVSISLSLSLEQPLYIIVIVIVIKEVYSLSRRACALQVPQQKRRGKKEIQTKKKKHFIYYSLFLCFFNPVNFFLSSVYYNNTHLVVVNLFTFTYLSLSSRSLHSSRSSRVKVYQCFFFLLAIAILLKV
ncbi:hypothetical protein CPC08DRAFT_123073 [Agrocybe pediades]|nr:hypothetical protein CPC08DRAFT_123073 [Agrocybe pediades]